MKPSIKRRSTPGRKRIITMAVGSSPGGEATSHGSDLRFVHRNRSRSLLAETVLGVTRLMDLPEIARPNEGSHLRAHQMLTKLHARGFNTPANDVYADPDRAIRLLWSSGPRNVEVVFPPVSSEAPYLYHSCEHSYGIEENPTTDCALQWLGWVFKVSAPDQRAA